MIENQKNYHKKWGVAENKLPVLEVKNRGSIKCFLKEEV